jgi:hypothetical protein
MAIFRFLPEKVACATLAEFPSSHDALIYGMVGIFLLPTFAGAALPELSPLAYGHSEVWG